MRDKKLGEILAEAFGEDPGLKTKAIASAKHACQQSQLGRIFNDCPSLLCPDDLAAIVSRFADILRCLPDSAVDTELHVFYHDDTERRIKRLILDLAILAKGELLTRYSIVKNALLDALDLHRYSGQLTDNKREIVGSYVSMCLADGMQKIPENLRNTYQQQFLSIENYINANTQKILNMHFIHRDRKIILRDFDAEMNGLMNYPREHPTQTAVGFTALTLVGIASAIGYFISRSISCQEQPNPTFRR